MALMRRGVGPIKGHNISVSGRQKPQIMGYQRFHVCKNVLIETNKLRSRRLK